MTLAIDGSVHATTTASSKSVALTTSNANDYIIVCVTTNGGPVTSVTSAHLTFSFMASSSGSAATNEVWSAFSSGALSSESITVNTTSSSFLTIDAFGVSGSNQASAIFDSGGPQTGTVDPVSITTANTNTMVIAAYREGSAGSPTAGTGFTAVSGADFQLAEYKVLSTTATTSCTQTTGSGTANGGVAFAIVQTSGGGGDTFANNGAIFFI